MFSSTAILHQYLACTKTTVCCEGIISSKQMKRCHIQYIFFHIVVLKGWEQKVRNLKVIDRKKKLKMKNATYKSVTFTGSMMKDLLSH